jgi:hypothetical protein
MEYIYIYIIMKWSNRNTHILNEPIYKKKWATIYVKFKIVWLEQIMMKGFGTCLLQTKLCLFRIFNKSICKMIDAFMNTE